jgi:aminopeptidase-like protein
MERLDSNNKKGVELYRLVERLYPICRSITGNGVRETLDILTEYLPLDVHNIKSGTRVFDWVIPNEWNIREAYIKNAAGEKILDFNSLNLHVLNYSVPVNKKVRLAELKEHLFTCPEHPDWVPYRTSYHHEAWGFCMTHRQYLGLADELYEVVIDSTLEPGSLTYGELFIPGESDEEFLISTHICHPSLCNDNLSGIALATFIAKELLGKKLDYSYRFVFAPGTIGSIAWLSVNKEALDKIKHGLVISLLGDGSRFHYKKSRRGNAEIDRIVNRVLARRGGEFEILDFSPYGYDERQYCSPGINLPVGLLTRLPNGKFPEYHTSADNLEFVSPVHLAESEELLLAIISELESAEKYINQNPNCEPQLGSRGLYQGIGGHTQTADFQMALLWVLNLSDGEHSLDDIAEDSGLKLELLREAVSELLEADLLVKKK